MNLKASEACEIANKTPEMCVYSNGEAIYCIMDFLSSLIIKGFHGGEM
jgi:hypothetical protein